MSAGIAVLLVEKEDGSVRREACIVTRVGERLRASDPSVTANNEYKKSLTSLTPVLSKTHRSCCTSIRNNRTSPQELGAVP